MFGDKRPYFGYICRVIALEARVNTRANPVERLLVHAAGGAGEYLFVIGQVAHAFVCGDNEAAQRSVATLFAVPFQKVIKIFVLGFVKPFKQAVERARAVLFLAVRFRHNFERAVYAEGIEVYAQKVRAEGVYSAYVGERDFAELGLYVGARRLVCHGAALYKRRAQLFLHLRRRFFGERDGEYAV